MFEADDLASIDALRDLDEEDETEGLETEGTYQYVVSVTTKYYFRATDPDDAMTKFMDDVADGYEEEDPIVRRVEDDDD